MSSTHTSMLRDLQDINKELEEALAQMEADMHQSLPLLKAAEHDLEKATEELNTDFAELERETAHEIDSAVLNFLAQ